MRAKRARCPWIRIKKKEPGPKGRQICDLGGAPEARNRGERARSAGGAEEGSQGRVRAKRARCPWIRKKKESGPKGRQNMKCGPLFCRPSGAASLRLNDPGAACFALAPGYPIPRLRRFAPYLPGVSQSAGRVLPRLRRFAPYLPGVSQSAGRVLPRLRRFAQYLPGVSICRSRSSAPSALTSSNAHLSIVRTSSNAHLSLDKPTTITSPKLDTPDHLA